MMQVIFASTSLGFGSVRGVEFLHLQVGDDDPALLWVSTALTAAAEEAKVMISKLSLFPFLVLVPWNSLES